MFKQAAKIVLGFMAVISVYALLLIVFQAGQRDAASKFENARQEKAEIANKELSDLLSEMNSPGYRFLLLRKALNEKQLPGWSLSPSAIAWSTLTVDFSDGLGGLTENDVITVWEKWQEPRTKLTIELQERILIETGNAVLDAIKDREGEAAFDSEGFLVKILAANYDFKGGQFVRISFMESRFAELLMKEK